MTVGEDELLVNAKGLVPGFGGGLNKPFRPTAVLAEAEVEIEEGG